ncbi:outer membrane immunogenic protein [Mesorhizobium soli]|uniref:outer membrane protein n=1 Tax=Pseudaminobacter soli (ex Li et al. 2025) TaxID=1295366 RepID=UPI002476FFB1|nr:porin family protein [Mesorhizobium soli]MDH6229586.1 outer membrane immunogenic protein [Mesorhizobium soli]
MFSKRIAVLAAFSTILSTGAFAADIVVPEVIPVFSWTGAYVGLNAGFGGGKFKHELPVVGPAPSFNPSSNGFVGGVQVGYNYQIDQWVVGAEADFQGASIKGETDLGSLVGGPKLGTKLDWYGTVRARAGVLATDRLLVYATGGLAYGHTKTFIEDAVFGISESKTKAGWTVGAGVEYAVTDHVSLKTEYAYTDLGKAQVLEGMIDRKVNFHTVKFGINYKF